MSDKHPAPWRESIASSVPVAEDANGIPLSVFAIISTYNALAAERDECLRQNAAMVNDLKAAHDANELTKAKLRRAVEAVDVSWLDTTCKCPVCQHHQLVLAENAELLKEE